MKNVDQELHAALVRIVRALDASDRGYCVIGALVPRLLMLTPHATPAACRPTSAGRRSVIS